MVHSHVALLRALLLRETELRAVAAGVLLASTSALLVAAQQPASGDPAVRSLTRLLGGFETLSASLVGLIAMILVIERIAADRDAGWLPPLGRRSTAVAAYPVLVSVAAAAACTAGWLLAMAVYGTAARTVPGLLGTMVPTTALRTYACATFAAVVVLVVRSKGLAQAVVFTWTFAPIGYLVSQFIAGQQDDVTPLMQFLVRASPAGVLLIDETDVARAGIAALMVAGVSVLAGPRLMDRAA